MILSFQPLNDLDKNLRLCNLNPGRHFILTSEVCRATDAAFPVCPASLHLRGKGNKSSTVPLSTAVLLCGLFSVCFVSKMNNTSLGHKMTNAAINSLFCTLFSVFFLHLLVVTDCIPLENVNQIMSSKVYSHSFQYS